MENALCFGQFLCGRCCVGEAIVFFAVRSLMGLDLQTSLCTGRATGMVGMYVSYK